MRIEPTCIFRYIFNCGEGTQRLSLEHPAKLSRVENIFLTRNTWDRFGGVPGFSLTLQQSDVLRLTVHAPPRIKEIFQNARLFVLLHNMKVECPECKDGETWEDPVMKVTYVRLYKDNQRPSDEKSKKKGDGTTEKVDIKMRNRSRKAGKIEETSNKEDNVMAFICKLQERAGSLDLDMCVDKGVEPGPLLGRLKNGFDVILPNGTVVKASEVHLPSAPGSVFIFIDIPDESYIADLENNEAFVPYQSTAVRHDDIALIVVHFTPEHMMEHPVYKKWIEKFSPSTVHWFVNERNQFSGYLSAHRIQNQLNEVDDRIFPLLKEPHPAFRQDLATEFRNYAKVSQSDQNMEIECKNQLGEFNEYPELGILTAFHIRPLNGFDRSMELFSKPATAEKKETTSEENVELIEKFKKEAKKLTANRTTEQRAKEFPKIVTLGTGSGQPNKTRNTSGYLIHISDDECVLFDCSEGTLGQIVRFYGRDGADEVLRKLRMIYVSHMHPDHHLGLIGLLNRRRLVCKDKVLLMAPFPVSTWLEFYNNRIEEISSLYDFFCSDDLARSWNMKKGEKENLCKRLGLVNIKLCYVKHYMHSFGIAIEMKNTMKCERYPSETIKITYSGDTVPCGALVNIGENSDVLIHEATMEDDLKDQALVKRHSTVSQAIDIGRQMNAKFVILIHFSQRYAKIPMIPDGVENVAIAFDNMEVTLNDLPIMHLMYEPLKAIFSDHVIVMEQRAVKRKRRKEGFSLLKGDPEEI